MLRREMLSLLPALVLLGDRTDAGPRRETTAALLNAGSEFGETTAKQAAAALRALLDLADMARTSKLPAHLALHRTIFEAAGFSREVKDTSLGFVLLPLVLAKRQGSCVGLGCLCLALAELLGVPAAGVMRPGHFYVRLLADPPRNVELLRQGEEMPDSWYAQRFPVQHATSTPYGQALTLQQVLGVVAYDVGNERRRQERVTQAANAFARAVERFPNFAEAHASHASTLHLLGNLQGARQSYRRALQLAPSLPGAAENLALLEREAGAH